MASNKKSSSQPAPIVPCVRCGYPLNLKKVKSLAESKGEITAVLDTLFEMYPAKKLKVGYSVSHEVISAVVLRLAHVSYYSNYYNRRKRYDYIVRKWRKQLYELHGIIFCAEYGTGLRVASARDLNEQARQQFRSGVTYLSKARDTAKLSLLRSGPKDPLTREEEARAKQVIKVTSAMLSKGTKESVA